MSTLTSRLSHLRVVATGRLRILALGAICALLVGLGGCAVELWRVGSTTESALDRVERELRDDFDARVATLRSTVRRIVSSEGFGAAVVAGEDSAARLFDDVGRARAATVSELALTVYSPNGSPIAWAGRASEIPTERHAAPAFFVAPGPVGWRLVYVEPVFDRAPEGDTLRRVGAVAAERVLAPSHGVQPSMSTGFVFETSLTPVTLWPRFVGASDRFGELGFPLTSPEGETLLEARVSREDLADARQTLRATTVWSVLTVLAITLALVAGSFVETRASGRSSSSYVKNTASLVLTLVLARVLFSVATPLHWQTESLFASFPRPFPLLGWAGQSPFDFLLTAVLMMALVAASVDTLRRIRVARRRQRIDPSASWLRTLVFVAVNLVAGLVALVLILWSYAVLASAFNQRALEAAHFALIPWSASRSAVTLGLALFHGALFWAAVLVLRGSRGLWRLQRERVIQRAVLAGSWLLPLIAILTLAGWREWPVPRFALALTVATVVAVAWSMGGLGWFRRGSQALRLAALFAALWLPTLEFYPAALSFATATRREQVETEYAPQVMGHREELRTRLLSSLRQVDDIPSLADVVESRDVLRTGPTTDAAFSIWQRTDLATYRLTSAVELYRADGTLLSRFALNVPEYAATNEKRQVTDCDWELFGETTDYASGERPRLHAERGICVGGPGGSRRTVGAIVIHVTLDYPALAFISSQDPYSEFFRTGREIESREARDSDIVLVIYGWGRSPVYSSVERAWPLDGELFQRVYASREPFWTALQLGEDTYDVYYSNDRQGIYAVGYPRRAVFDYLVDLAELSTLVALAFAVVLVASALLVSLAGLRPPPGRQLVREVRQSFYRKLFLAFVLAAVIPGLLLAFLIRAYVLFRLEADVEAEAARTAAVAQRVIEESLALQHTGSTPATITDDVMVWISRVIEQDVNIFAGAELIATSERDLFASGLLPTRTPDGVYRAIVLQRLSSFVGVDQIANFSYLMAATPIRTGTRDTILTVPLALRQREIERRIEQLDRGVNLGVLVFILLGAGIGFWMAERIGDPVHRLTRATRRIASGDLDARVIVKSADELERLVEAFNRMAEELKRQRIQLERTNRLEAWAEMARQVAHDIKNPLTPIQLSAEHLRRVNEDKGRPLTPVLESCIGTILKQVRLLRQISSEFSSFASSPTARLAPAKLADIVREVTEGYMAGGVERVRFVIGIDSELPALLIDRTLLGRALTNIIENALHAMPAGGVLTIRGWRDGDSVRLSLSDTGVGMDSEALKRIFEPYFSTKATGTGLGLTIAKRNVELNGGMLQVTSAPDRGTTVTVIFPLALAAETEVGTVSRLSADVH